MPGQVQLEKYTGIANGIKCPEVPTWWLRKMTVNIISTRKEYLCNSDDEKPTASILAGAFMYEVDTGLTYIFSGTDWVEKRDPAPLTFMELMNVQKNVLDQLQVQLEMMNKYLSILTNEEIS